MTTRADPWFWLRDREDPEVLAYLEAENAFTEAQTAPLAGFRDGLFEEMKARIKETDMSVPARRGPWWYYARTEEGKSYAIHCRRPARGPGELPPAGEPGDEEQILLDENVLAEGSEYFAVGSAAVSHDHRWLAYCDRPRPATRSTSCASCPSTPRPPSPSPPRWCPTPATGWPGRPARTSSSTCAWTRPSVPHQLWRHRLGTDPAGDELVYEETDRRFSLGAGSTRDTAFVLVGLHSTNTSEWLRHPVGRAARRAGGGHAPAARASSTRSTT